MVLSGDSAYVDIVMLGRNHQSYVAYIIEGETSP